MKDLIEKAIELIDSLPENDKKEVIERIMKTKTMSDYFENNKKVKIEYHYHFHYNDKDWFMPTPKKETFEPIEVTFTTGSDSTENFYFLKTEEDDDYEFNWFI